MACVGGTQAVCLDAAELEMVATGRGARLVYLLVLHRRIRVATLASLLACSERHIYRMAANATLAAVPVAIDDGWVELWLDGSEY